MRAYLVGLLLLLLNVDHWLLSHLLQALRLEPLYNGQNLTHELKELSEV